MSQQQLPSYVNVGKATYWGDLGLFRWRDERITIGKYCSIAKGVRLLAGGGHNTSLPSTFPFDVMINGCPLDRNYVEGPGIEIGNDVWIGYGAMVIGHVRIGHGAVIGAGAVVMSDIPPYMIALGNPARPTKPRFSEDITNRLLKLKWWDWPEDKIRAFSLAGFYGTVENFLSVAEEMEMDKEVAHA